MSLDIQFKLYTFSNKDDFIFEGKKGQDKIKIK